MKPKCSNLLMELQSEFSKFLFSKVEKNLDVSVPQTHTECMFNSLNVNRGN